jgi:hypothetical protein
LRAAHIGRNHYHLFPFPGRQTRLRAWNFSGGEHRILPDERGTLSPFPLWGSITQKFRNGLFPLKIRISRKIQNVRARLITDLGLVVSDGQAYRLGQSEIKMGHLTGMPRSPCAVGCRAEDIAEKLIRQSRTAAAFRAAWPTYALLGAL